MVPLTSKLATTMISKVWWCT